MSQRITNMMMIDSFNRNLNRNNVKMDRYQSQLATNRKIVRLSDDPVGVIKSLAARTRLAGIEQYQSNLNDARALLTQSESSVMEVNEVLKRVNELAVNLANEVKTPEDRQASAYEIKELMDQIVTVGNATLGDKYLFGGYNVTKAPFAVVNGEMTFNGASMVDPLDLPTVNQLNQVISYEIGFGTDLPVSIPGADLMGTGDSNIYKVMSDFYAAANSPDLEDLSPFIKKIQDVQSNVLSIAAEIGGRQNRLDLMSTRFEQDVINYTQMKSDVEDLDQAEAIMKFSMAEAVYRAALSVGGRILQPTLVDFLK